MPQYPPPPDTSVPDIGGGSTGGGWGNFAQGAAGFAGSLIPLITALQGMNKQADVQNALAGQPGLDPSIVRLLRELGQSELATQQMQQQRYSQQQPLFEAVTRGALQRLPLSMRGILPTPGGSHSSPLIGSFNTFQSPGAPKTSIKQPGTGVVGAGGQGAAADTSFTPGDRTVQDFISTAPRRGGADSGQGRKAIVGAAGAAAAPFTFGLSALAGPIASLFGGAADTAPTDVPVMSARQILNDAIVEAQGRSPGPGEIDELLRRQGWQVGDRWVGETGLRFLLDGILAGSSGAKIGIAPGVEPEQVTDLR